LIVWVEDTWRQILLDWNVSISLC